MQFLQLVTRVEAEFLAQRGTHPPIFGEGLGLPAATVQRPHELAAQPLLQREPVDRGGQIADQVVRPAGGQFEFGPGLEGGDVLLVEGGGGEAYAMSVDTRRGVSAPQVERTPVEGRVVSLPGLGDQAGELGRIQFARARREAVTRGITVDHVGGQGAAQTGHTGLKLAARGGRRVSAPDRVRERTDTQHATGVQKKHGQHDAITACRDGDALSVDGDGQWPEDAIAHAPHLSDTLSLLDVTRAE